MAILNYKSREIIFKIVYFGPALGGKTTSLKAIHLGTSKTKCSELQTITTEGDRTLFFDYFSLDAGEIGGLEVRFQLYTVPGDPVYRATRKLVLAGADGVVFVADSASNRVYDNLAAYGDLKSLLQEHGYSYDETPLVMQYNKRDLEKKVAVEDLESLLNERHVPYFESIATEGKGVREPLRAICAAVVERLKCDLAERESVR